MLYHLIIWSVEEEYRHYNKTREEVLTNFICPFIKREITLLENKIFNMLTFSSISVFQSEQPVDSDYPVKKQDFIKEDKGSGLWKYRYRAAVEEALKSGDVTQEFYREAIVLIETDKYRELRREIIEKTKGKYSFFICPLGNDEVIHNYEYVIKPIVKQFQFDIQKADEISHTGVITDEILSSISKSRFIVADLTDSRPNCYYEVGYAHSLGKPVIILAKEGTEPHFDISAYKWNFWKDYKELKPIFEKELSTVLKNLGF